MALSAALLHAASFPRSLAELAEALAVPAARIDAELRRLEARGYVARISCGRAASPCAWCSLRATCGPTVTERWVTRDRRG